jgi:hypothetical protein
MPKNYERLALLLVPLIIVAAMVFVVIWAVLHGESLSDLPNGWATLLGACLQMGAVYFAARMGFRAQDRHTELARQCTVKALVAPINAELVHDYEYLAETMMANRATLEAVTAGNAAQDSTCVVIRYIEFGTEIFDAHRARLGELGSFLAYVITRNFLFMKAASRDERITVRVAEAPAVIEDILLAQNARLKSMGYVIDLLQAVDETGSTDEPILRARVAARPQSAFAGGVALDF